MLSRYEILISSDGLSSKNNIAYCTISKISIKNLTTEDGLKTRLCPFYLTRNNKNPKLPKFEFFSRMGIRDVSRKLGWRMVSLRGFFETYLISLLDLGKIDDVHPITSKSPKILTYRFSHTAKILI